MLEHELAQPRRKRRRFAQFLQVQMRFNERFLRGVARRLDFTEPAERRAHREILKRHHEIGECGEIPALRALDDCNVGALCHSDQVFGRLANKTRSDRGGIPPLLKKRAKPVQRIRPNDTRPSSRHLTYLRTGLLVRNRSIRSRQRIPVGTATGASEWFFCNSFMRYETAQPTLVKSGLGRHPCQRISLRDVGLSPSFPQLLWSGADRIVRTLISLLLSLIHI
jgi:hypothetical protein